MRYAPSQLLLSLAIALAAVVPGRRSDSLAETRVTTRVERLTATVRAVDLEGRTIELVTGVGYALRIERVEVPAEVKVEGRGTRGALSSVTPGCIVRVGCHHSAATMVAWSLELIERPAPASKP